jgi:hypothetical protein
MNYPITILDQPSPDTVRFIVRATVPVALRPRFADATKAPLYDAMNAADLAALRAGEIVERVETDTIPGKTLAQVKASVISAQAAFQAEVSAANFDLWKFYGVQYNGTVWG